MFKRVIPILLSAVCLCMVCYVNRTPVFGKFASELELYIGAPDSTAQIITVNAEKVPFISSVYGEAFTTSREEFNLNQFLDEFRAEMVFTESIEQGVSYYAYSSNIKYGQLINGKRVNLQVFIGDSTVKVGSPIICGSF